MQADAPRGGRCAIRRIALRRRRKARPDGVPQPREARSMNTLSMATTRAAIDINSRLHSQNATTRPAGPTRFRIDSGRFQSLRPGTRTHRGTTQVDDHPASPCSEISFAARAPGTHNRCDVEVQRTRRAAGRHHGSRTTDEGDTHHGPAQQAGFAPHHRYPPRAATRRASSPKNNPGDSAQRPPCIQMPAPIRPARPPRPLRSPPSTARCRPAICG